MTHPSTPPSRRLLGALLSVLLASAPSASASPDWLTVPEADLVGLEEAVAKQLTDLRELVLEQVADSALTGPQLGEALGELGKHFHAYTLSAAAAQCYAIAQRLAPDDFRWPYLAGHLAQTEGRLEDAVPLFEQALRIVPDVAPALVRLGQALLALGRPEDAQQVLRRAVELNPTEAAAYAALGQLFLSARAYAEAIDAFERALDLQPEANRIYYSLALAYRGLGDSERFEELVGKRGSVGVRPADPLIDGLAGLTTGERVRTLTGRRAFAAGRYVEAVAEFRGAVEAAPDSVSANINLAAALTETGAVLEAVEYLERAVELAPGNSIALYNLGLLLERQGRLQPAIERFAEAVSYDPDDSEMHRRLADALRRSAQTDQAHLHYEKAVELDAADEEAWVGAAETLVRLGQLSDALERLETASAQMPGSGIVAHALARFLAAAPDTNLRDGQRALDLASKVVRARVTVPHVRTLAMAYAETGRCEEASVWATQALEEAKTRNDPALSDRLSQEHAHYAAGPPCRPPLAASLSPQPSEP